MFSSKVAVFVFLFVATVIREEVGLQLEKVGAEVLGNAGKVVLTKDTTTIVGDGSTEEVVKKRVEQIKNLIEVYISKAMKFCRLFVCFVNSSLWVCVGC